MKTLKPLMLGLCLTATGAAMAAPPDLPSADRPAASWPVVPDAVLERLRGGIDLSNLVAYFAIQRVVEVDGEVVARAQIVISNLDRLASGGLPTVTVSGPLSQIIQVTNGDAPAVSLAVASGSAPPAGIGASSPAPSSTASIPLAITTTASPMSGLSSPNGAAARADGTISSSGSTQSGSTAQFGSALSSAVGAANGGSAPAQTVASGSAAITVPIIVVSNLPDATAITTAVQNDVRAATIQTETTITATSNSLPAVNSLALASAIQSQVASSIGH